ncbi:IS5 family transposase [Streptomyces sasae]|uniref:IS5 family transposase n=1 Tax=Streptomyces sasae TaxID=1266772 RepID=UPI00292E9ACE|nr:IS5 family transposase [Streptomyces sasae]
MRKGQQPPWIVADELWARIEPLLPVVPRRPDHPGRRRLDDRKVLSGILFVLHTGIPWEFLPQEMGFGSGMTCWRRLRDWNDAGVWQRLHESLLAELNAAGALDWSRAVIDGSHVRALKGGPKTGPSPVDRARTGSKHHLITEAHGIPLAVSLTGGNRNDVTQLMPLIEAVPPVRGRRGRPRRRPDTIYADRGYDHDKYRKQVRAVGVTPVIARRGTGHGSGLGIHRWVVEQSFALLHWFRRLRIRWEIRDDIHEAFLSLACGIICWRRLQVVQRRHS